jgi:hypothetical protein
MHCDRFLVNKTNRRTECQLYYWYFNSTRLGSLSAHHQEFLSRTTALVQFMQFGDRVLP